jgi:protein-S-isoprenylcysteine O-methyltransferase Ste14
VAQTTHKKDGATVRIPPPMIYLAAVIAGVLFHAFVLPLPMRLPLVVRLAAAIAVGLMGALIMVSAAVLFRRSGQDPKPWMTTPEIISSGIYGLTRNPMYVGMALLQAAIGIGLATSWVLALVPPVLVVVYLTAIRHEEAYLANKFGEAYFDYKKSVRRWF